MNEHPLRILLGQIIASLAGTGQQEASPCQFLHLSIMSQPDQNPQKRTSSHIQTPLIMKAPLYQSLPRTAYLPEQ